MGWWVDHVVPRVVDRALAGDDMDALRDRACAGLSGDVMEIGFGSGLNVGHYPVEVTGVSAVDPSDVGWRLAAPRVASSRVPIRRGALLGQRLAAGDGVFDSALSTFTLCTIPDVRAAIGEVRRVLRPGGLFHFLEHGRSPDPGVAGWQRRLEPLQRLAFGGCHLTRPIAELVGEQLELVDVEQRYLPGPRSSRPFAYVSLGTARRPVVQPPEPALDEVVALVDRTGAVVGSAPRAVVRRENLLHSATAVLVRDGEGRIYVHRRSPDKDWAPGAHDAAAGGVLQVGEQPEPSAHRELAEELGITGAELRPLGLSVFEDDTTRCVEHVFETTWTGPVRHADGEVVWGAWLTLSQLDARLAAPGWAFVPDTRAVLTRLARAGVADYAALGSLVAR